MPRSPSKPAHPKSRKRPTPAAKRMAEYRARLRAAGLKPVQLWLPDTKDPQFIAACREQARRLAEHDRAGDEIDRDFAEAQDWPKP